MRYSGSFHARAMSICFSFPGFSFSGISLSPFACDRLAAGRHACAHIHNPGRSRCQILSRYRAAATLSLPPDATRRRCTLIDSGTYRAPLRPHVTIESQGKQCPASVEAVFRALCPRRIGLPPDSCVMACARVRLRRSKAKKRMPSYSALELPYARPVANALLTQLDFRYWLLSGTRREIEALKANPIGKAQAVLRSPGLKSLTGSTTGAPRIDDVLAGSKQGSKRTFSSSSIVVPIANLNG